MAQTKRKRRGKHRGNAIGMVESRGRAGSKPNAPAERKATTTRGTGGAVRKPALPKPPSWRSAALKAVFGCLILFLFFTLANKKGTVSGALVFSLFAFVLYTPVMFYTDRYLYNRKLAAAKKR